MASEDVITIKGAINIGNSELVLDPCCAALRHSGASLQGLAATRPC
jgi:hypothetical protein